MPRKGRLTAYDVYAAWCRGADRVSVYYGQWCELPGTRALLEEAWATGALPSEAAPECG